MGVSRQGPNDERTPSASAKMLGTSEAQPPWVRLSVRLAMLGNT